MKTFLLKHSLEIMAVLSAFFSPIGPLLLTTGCMLVSDLCTGIFAAHRRKENIESAKMGRTVTKLTLYGAAIVLGHMMEVFLVNWVPIAKITASIICTVEFKSILENIKTITGLDIFSAIKDKLNEKR